MFHDTLELPAGRRVWDALHRIASHGFAPYRSLHARLIYRLGGRGRTERRSCSQVGSQAGSHVGG